MREEKAVPEYCKNNPKKIRAYQCEILPGGILARLRRPGRVPGSVQTHRGARKNRSTSVNCPNRTERGLHHGKV